MGSGTGKGRGEERVRREAAALLVLGGGGQRKTEKGRDFRGGDDERFDLGETAYCVLVCLFIGLTFTKCGPLVLDEI